MRKITDTGLGAHASFGPLAAILAPIGGFLGTAASTVASTVGGTLGSVLGSAGVSAATGSTPLIPGGLGLLSTGASIAALASPPKPPPIPAAPTAPSFLGGLSGGSNKSLAAASPFAALGGTNTNAGPAPRLGAKTLLGQ